MCGRRHADSLQWVLLVCWTPLSQYSGICLALFIKDFHESVEHFDMEWWVYQLSVPPPSFTFINKVGIERRQKTKHFKVPQFVTSPLPNHKLNLFLVVLFSISFWLFNMGCLEFHEEFWQENFLNNVTSTSSGEVTITKALEDQQTCGTRLHTVSPTWCGPPQSILDKVTNVKHELNRIRENLLTSGASAESQSVANDRQTTWSGNAIQHHIETWCANINQPGETW